MEVSFNQKTETFERLSVSSTMIVLPLLFQKNSLCVVDEDSLRPFKTSFYPKIDIV